MFVIIFVSNHGPKVPLGTTTQVDTNKREKGSNPTEEKAPPDV